MVALYASFPLIYIFVLSRYWRCSLHLFLTRRWTPRENWSRCLLGPDPRYVSMCSFFVLPRLGWYFCAFVNFLCVFLLCRCYVGTSVIYGIFIVELLLCSWWVQGRAIAWLVLFEMWAFVVDLTSVSLMLGFGGTVPQCMCCKIYRNKISSSQYSVHHFSFGLLDSGLLINISRTLFL